MVAIKRHGDGKQGRQQLRKVMRTSRRPEVSDEPVNSVDNGYETPDTEDISSDVQTDEQVPDKAKAYDALLTLISADHQVAPAISKKNNKSLQTSEDVESETDEIVGFNVEKEEDDDNEEEPQEDEDEDETDPFQVHFNNITDEYVEEQERHVDEKWPFKSKNSLDSYTYMFQVPQGTPIPTTETTKPIEDLPIKKRVLSSFEKSGSQDVSKLDLVLLNAMSQYKDINMPYFSHKNQTYKKMYAIHALNHIYKTRDSILKNNARLHNYQENLKSGKTPEEVEYRDQGFTRPKVLILLPTREACYEIVSLLIKYSGTEQQENKKRFTGQFHVDAVPPPTKPDDFKHYFKGNTNDFFTIGIKFTRKSLKLYSSFYSSDIILASPIGLSMILEHEDKRKREQDFLSSIEVVIVDNANQLEMQNWSHINTVFKYLNSVPKKFHDADFSRIRMWSINDKANFFTQKLVFSEYQTPNINNIVNKSTNMAGRVKFKKVITSDNCIMNAVGLKVKQVFQRFDCENPTEDPDGRFKFFTNSVFGSVSNSTSYDDGLLIVIPSYFDFIHVKDYMQNHSKVTFAAIDEYTSQSKLTKARQQFISGDVKILLYSERLHHFRRFEIAGVKNILLYGVPTNPLFYKEYLKFIGKSVFNGLVDLNLSFVKTIYSKWDAVALERIVGNQRAPILCNSINETYEFK